MHIHLVTRSLMYSFNDSISIYCTLTITNHDNSPEKRDIIFWVCNSGACLKSWVPGVFPKKLVVTELRCEGGRMSFPASGSFQPLELCWALLSQEWVLSSFPPVAMPSSHSSVPVLSMKSLLNWVACVSTLVWVLQDLGSVPHHRQGNMWLSSVWLVCCPNPAISPRKQWLSRPPLINYCDAGHGEIPKSYLLCGLLCG